MIVRREFLMLTQNANLAEFNGLNLQVQPRQSRAHRAHVHSHRAEVGTTHGALEQHQGSVCFESRASGGNNPSSLSGFSSNHPGINVPSAPEDHPDQSLWKTALALSRQFRGLAILFPFWLETSQCPSLTSSVVIQQWTAWQGMNHGGLAQVLSLDFVTRRSDLSAIITTACNKFSNINCTVPALEPRKTNTILPPPWLWLHVSSTTIAKLGEDAKIASQEDAEKATKHLRKVLKRTVMEIHLYTSTHLLYFWWGSQHSPLQTSF